MKATVMRPAEVEVASVQIDVSVRYGDEDMPFDFPKRDCDCGTYCLLDPVGNLIASIEQDYVPHGVVPGDYGDYIDLKINSEGVITNWPNPLDLSEFFDDENDD